MVRKQSVHATRKSSVVGKKDMTCQTHAWYGGETHGGSVWVTKLANSNGTTKWLLRALTRGTGLKCIVCISGTTCAILPDNPRSNLGSRAVKTPARPSGSMNNTACQSLNYDRSTDFSAVLYATSLAQVLSRLRSTWSVPSATTSPCVPCCVRFRRRSTTAIFDDESSAPLRRRAWGSDVFGFIWPDEDIIRRAISGSSEYPSIPDGHNPPDMSAFSYSFFDADWSSAPSEKRTLPTPEVRPVDAPRVGDVDSFIAEDGTGMGLAATGEVHELRRRPRRAGGVGFRQRHRHRHQDRPQAHRDRLRVGQRNADLAVC